MKLCTDCAHYWRRPTPWWGFPDPPWVYTHNCLRKHSEVTGEKIKLSCDAERAENGWCSPTGYGWKPK